MNQEPKHITRLPQRPPPPKAYNQSVWQVPSSLFIGGVQGDGSACYNRSSSQHMGA